MSGFEPPRLPEQPEPVRWEDEDALFSSATGDGPAGEGLHDGVGTEDEHDRAERERLERARRSRNPVVRMTAGLPRSLRLTIDWVVTIAGAIAIVLAIKAWVVNPYRIPSSSMEPTLHCARPNSGCEARPRFEDRVLANRFVYHFREPSRGDIVVFTTPPAAAQKCGAGGTFVKRLIALPGETWEQRDGAVYIDGKLLMEPYVTPDRRDQSTYPPRRIPDGKYFFMGDNRSQSCDSREWGAVSSESIIGEVFFVYWPPTRLGFRAALVLLGFVVILPVARRGGRWLLGRPLQRFR